MLHEMSGNLTQNGEAAQCKEQVCRKWSIFLIINIINGTCVSLNLYKRNLSWGTNVSNIVSISTSSFVCWVSQNNRGSMAYIPNWSFWWHAIGN